MLNTELVIERCFYFWWAQLTQSFLIFILPCWWADRGCMGSHRSLCVLCSSTREQAWDLGKRSLGACFSKDNTEELHFAHCHSGSSKETSSGRRKQCMAAEGKDICEFQQKGHAHRRAPASTLITWKFMMFSWCLQVLINTELIACQAELLWRRWAHHLNNNYCHCFPPRSRQDSYGPALWTLLCIFLSSESSSSSTVDEDLITPGTNSH